MVKIGTPMTAVGKKAVLCGSGELGKEVALELQRFGVEVVALDRYENAPAMQVAHRSYVLSMLDGERLREIIEKEKPDYIIPDGASLPFLFTGSLLLESFFGIPGLGFAGVDALYNSDIQLLKALVVLSAFLFVTINLLADLAYAWADPRIRLE